MADDPPKEPRLSGADVVHDEHNAQFWPGTRPENDWWAKPVAWAERYKIARENRAPLDTLGSD